MKIYNILVVLVMGILVVSSTGGFLGARENTVSNTIGDSEAVIETTNFYLNIGEPTLSYQDDFVTIELDESESFLSDSGEPMLPVIAKTFDFPVGTIINNVNVNINWERLDLDRKITPTPVSLPKSTEIEVDPDYFEENSFNEEIYSSAELFPTEPYTVRYGAGLKDMEHVMFVNVKCFPQYSPANDYVNIPTAIDIDIDYEFVEPTGSFDEQYDLIIITGDALVDNFQPLVDHKISKGITTKMVTVEEIYAEYASASSYDWEQIKMYLADHVLDWDTKFVLLGGAHIGNTYDWYVPIFQSNNWDPNDEYGTWDLNYATDLYFADVYLIDQYGRFHMDNWDSNGNGIYAEGDTFPSGTDMPDYYPDVMLGRIPCIFEWEADVCVDKIINYENMADNSWFYDALLVGGDGFPPERYPGQAARGFYEGEIVGNIISDYLEDRGWASTRAFCSDEGDIKVNSAKDVYTEVDNGYGFVHMDGHSCPFSLGSYEPDTYISPEPPLTAFYNGFDARLFDCGYKLPFMINEGCHNAEFDVTGQEYIAYMFDAYDDHPDYGFALYNYEWIPHDVSSWFVCQEGGGAIGVIGNTALGSGYIDDGITHGLGGWLMIRYGQAIGDGAVYTGEVYTTGISAYIDAFDAYSEPDRIRVEEQVLLGDPSVKLGGYGSALGSDDSEIPEKTYGDVNVPVPTWSVGNSWTYALDNIDIDLTTTPDRGITLKLSSGDIILEVTDVTGDSYIASVTADGIDVAIGGFFDFMVEDVENIEIPTVNLDNILLNGQITIDKASLGIKDIDLVLSVELIENLDNLKDLIGIELPSFLDFLIPYMSIPANIEVDMQFDNPFEILQFPLENDKIWGVPANAVTVSIDGSVESIWLKVLNFLNKFINIVPAEFAKYLPDIDVSEILNDFGIDTEYDIDIPEIPATILAYHKDTSDLFGVLGSENINVKAGALNAVKIGMVKENGQVYYSEAKGTIVKIIGYLHDYIPIVDNLNLELKSTNT